MVFGKTLVLCSRFEGRLVRAGGAPVAGVSVVRTWKWALNGKTGRDETTTDADGAFRFPEVTRSSFAAALLPHEPSIRQEVVARGPDGDVLLYSVDKSSYERDAELRGRDLAGPGVRLVCRIDAEPNADGPFWGTCRGADDPE